MSSSSPPIPAPASPASSRSTSLLASLKSFFSWLFSTSPLKLIQSPDFDPVTSLPPSPLIPASRRFVAHFQKGEHECENDENIEPSTSSHKPPSLIRTFFRQYWRRLLLPLPCFVCEIVMRAVQPYLIHRLLVVISSSADNNMMNVIWSSVILFVVQVVMGIVHEGYYFGVRDVRLELQKLVPCVLYRKLLRLRVSSGSGKKGSGGAKNSGNLPVEEEETEEQKEENEVKAAPTTKKNLQQQSSQPQSQSQTWESQMMNLITTDVWRIAVPVNYLFNTPLIIIRFAIAFIYVYSFMGWSGTLFALLVLGLVLVPINFVVLRKRTKLDKERTDLTDERVGMIRVCIENIRFIKAFFWEKIYGDRIESVRAKEMQNLTWGCFIWSIVECLWATSPFFLSGAAIVGHVVIQKQKLTMPICFAMMTVMGGITGPIFGFANSLNGFAKARTSLARIEKFLALPEVANRRVGREEEGDEIELEFEEEIEGEEDDENKSSVVVSMKGCDFAWPTIVHLEEKKSDDPPKEKREEEEEDHHLNEEETTVDEPFLKDLNLRVLRGQMIAIVGEVGSGKTCLANALLGELIHTKGEFSILGGSSQETPICYCAQSHWVRGLSIRDNILFGEPFNEKMYRDVVKACSMEEDLASLEEGDLTKVGERGTRLSGGQKARVALARACYVGMSRDCEVFVFDDPIKDLDSEVCNRVFRNVFRKWLFGTTRILITHNQDVLGHADYIFVMDKGKIVEQGTFRELRAKALGQVHLGALQSPLSPFSPFGSSPEGTPTTIIAPSQEFVPQDTQEDEDDPMRKLGEKFDFRLLWKFLTYYPKTFAFFLFLLLSKCVLEFYRDYFAAGWSRDSEEEGESLHSTGYYLTIYLLSGVCVAVIVVVAQVVFAALCVWVAEHFHNEMLRAVLAAPVKFFDRATSGTVLARFSKDTDKIDGELRFNFRELFFIASYVAMTYIFIIIYVPTFVIGAIIPAILVYYIGRTSLRALLAFARFQASLHSPVMTHFNETIKGLQTIRAFRKEEMFVEELEQVSDIALRLSLLESSIFRWLCIRGRCLGSLVIFSFAVFAAITKLRGDISSLMISKLVNMIFDVAWLMLLIPAIQKNFISLERVVEYSELEPERYEGTAIADFPEKGDVEFSNVSFRYNEDAEEDVLKNISFRLRAGSHLGVVGRTGSGKSTLVKNLLRLYDVNSGSILLDGIDVSELSLECLRTSVSYIAQNPTLLPGSIRENLDVGGTRSDESMWEALRSVGLESKVRVLPSLLETEVGEEINFSAGEKQLLCFARAVLQKKKLLILDEATSSCDLATDSKVQQIVNESFRDRSIIAIAHRLETIADYDVIAVMSKGEIVEYAPPADLIQNEDSQFLEMINQTGRKRAKRLLSIIRRSGNASLIGNVEEEEEIVGVAVVAGAEEEEEEEEEGTELMTEGDN